MRKTGSLIVRFGICLGCLLATTAPLPAQELSASGSESLMYALSLWGDASKAKTPGVCLNVRVESEAQAMQDLTSGSLHIAMLARDALPDEFAAFRTRWGYLPTRIAVALDALIVVVNKDNPLKAIHMEEMDAIYTVNRAMGWPKDVLVWGDLGVRDPAWSGRPIVRYGRLSTFGLVEMYLPHQMIPRMPIHMLPDGMAMAEAIARDPDGICMANLVEEFASVRAVPVFPRGSEMAVLPTPETVTTGAYPYSRFLYLYVNKPPRGGLDPVLKGFLAFALSPEGQQLVKAAGQAPLPRDVLALNLEKVMDRVTPLGVPSIR